MVEKAVPAVNIGYTCGQCNKQFLHSYLVGGKDFVCNKCGCTHYIDTPFIRKEERKDVMVSNGNLDIGVKESTRVGITPTTFKKDESLCEEVIRAQEPVPAVLNNSFIEAQNLIDLIGRLNERLQPAMNPHDPSKTPPPVEDVGNSPIVIEVAKTQCLIRLCVCQIEDILTHLEI